MAYPAQKQSTREGEVALHYEVGQRFPDTRLLDERGQSTSIAEVAGGRPLILVFYRGPW